MLLLDSCLKCRICKIHNSTIRKIDLPVVSWTDVVAVYLGGRHWAHDGVYGVVHEAVGHAVLLDDVLAYWSET